MSELDYDALRKVARRRRFSAEIAKARQAEQARRYQTAYRRALRALVKVYPDDFEHLYRAARAEVDAERGPLPGDE